MIDKKFRLKNFLNGFLLFGNIFHNERIYYCTRIADKELFFSSLDIATDQFINIYETFKNFKVCFLSCE